MPNAFDMIFPVFTAFKGQTPGSLWGTAFPITKTLFLSARHVVENANQHIKDGNAEYIVLGKPEDNSPGSHVNMTVIKAFESHQSLDIALLEIHPDQFENILIQGWRTEALPLLANVATLGYPYALDLAAMALTSRGFKGHVVGNGPQVDLGPKFFGYELSFPAPRGLSGAPLYTDEKDIKVAGVIIGNASKEMEVVSEKEILEEGDRVEIYTKVEILHNAIAIQSDDIHNAKFDLIDSSIGNFLGFGEKRKD